ncbi:MAG: RNA polymerase sigma factor [Flavobacteriaceae bacterium]
MEAILSQHLNDAQLITDYAQGDEHALEMLIEKYQQRIFNFIFSKIHDRDLTEDIFQETFFKVIRTLKNGVYNEEGKFLPWVMRIAHNLVIDHFRKSNRLPRYETNDDFDIFQFIGNSEISAEDALIDEQIVQDLQRLILELPEDQREVLLMRVYKDMSFKEIAENTGVSINTALGRMRYAVINLRKLIEAHQIVLTH